jgi:outer membrane putative beta-barrel porin/alpha-amylase
MTWRPVVLAGLVPLWLTVAGQAADDDAVAPDRPDVTNSTQTVPAGAVQIETGIEYRRTSQAGAAAERRLAGQATLRAGVTRSLEIRLDGEPIVRLRGSEDGTAFGELVLGLKYRFLDQADQSWWPSLGVQPFVTLPTARPPVGSGRTDFGVAGLVSWRLPLDLSLDVNAGLTAVGQSGPEDYLLQGLASASFGKQITERLAGFVELFFASRDERDGRDSLGIDGGLVFLLTRWLALDAAVGTSLRGRVPDYVVRAGVSVRFGR